MASLRVLRVPRCGVGDDLPRVLRLRLGSVRSSTNSASGAASPLLLEELDLSDRRITDTGAAFLANYIRHNPFLRRLVLRNGMVSGDRRRP